MSFERAFKVNVEPGSGGFSTLWLTDVRRKRRKDWKGPSRQAQEMKEQEQKT